MQPEGFEAIPEGTYVFQLLPGAATRMGRNGIEELVIQTAITDGEQRGRRAFLQYPAPDSVSSRTGKKNAWSAQALKKLELALGSEAGEDETVVEYLNRIATNGHARFTAQITNRKDDATGRVYDQVSLFSVAPAP